MEAPGPFSFRYFSCLGFLRYAGRKGQRGCGDGAAPSVEKKDGRPHGGAEPGKESMESRGGGLESRERGERRREWRLPVTLDGTLRARDGRWAHPGVVEDLHRFGVRARIPGLESLDEDEAVVMDFSLPSYPEEVPGRVRWARPCDEGGLRCGIAFDEVLSLQLPLETVTTACARLQEETTGVRLRETSSLLEKTLIAMHGETWAGALLHLAAEPAQQVLNTLSARLELESLRLQKVLSESRNAFPEAPLHPVLARASNLFQELQGASSKIKEGITCLRTVQGTFILQPESSLYTVDPADVIRRSVSSMKALCAFLGGKMGAFRFKTEENKPPLLAVRPVDFRRTVDACLLGLMESALATDGSTLTVGSFAANGWIGVRFSHDGFRMLQQDVLHIVPEDARFMEKTSSRDEGTALRFYHAILPLREYGVSLHIHAESGRNRIQVRLPSVHAFPPGRQQPPGSHV